MTTAIVDLPFDYATLDAETRIVIQQRTGEIKALIRRTTQDLIDLGEKLQEVRERLRHNKSGGFEGWLALEAIDRRTAYNCIGVFDRFGNRATVAQLEQIGTKALYALAAPSVPDAAREEALRRAEAGERVSHRDAKAIIQAARAAVVEAQAAAQPAAQPETPPDLVAAGYRLLNSAQEPGKIKLLQPGISGGMVALGGNPYPDAATAIRAARAQMAQQAERVPAPATPDADARAAFATWQRRAGAVGAKLFSGTSGYSLHMPDGAIRVFPFADEKALLEALAMLEQAAVPPAASPALPDGWAWRTDLRPSATDGGRQPWQAQRAHDGAIARLSYDPAEAAANAWRTARRESAAPIVAPPAPRLPATTAPAPPTSPAPPAPPPAPAPAGRLMHGAAGSGRWLPVVPHVVVVSERKDCYTPAPIERVVVVYDTATTVRVAIPDGTQRTCQQHQVYALPDAAAWERTDALHTAFAEALAALAEALRALGRYDVRLAEAGGLKAAPNPLTPTAISCQFPDAENPHWWGDPWHVTSIQRKRITRHTAKMVFFHYADDATEESSAMQHGFAVCPDDAAASQIEALYAAAEAAREAFVAQLAALGTYDQAVARAMPPAATPAPAPAAFVPAPAPTRDLALEREDDEADSPLATQITAIVEAILGRLSEPELRLFAVLFGDGDFTPGVLIAPIERSWAALGELLRFTAAYAAEEAGIETVLAQIAEGVAA